MAEARRSANVVSLDVYRNAFYRRHPTTLRVVTHGNKRVALWVVTAEAALRDVTAPRNSQRE